MSLALQGRFLTAGPPRKPLSYILYPDSPVIHIFPICFIVLSPSLPSSASSGRTSSASPRLAGRTHQWGALGGGPRTPPARGRQANFKLAAACFPRGGGAAGKAPDLVALTWFHPASPELLHQGPAASWRDNAFRQPVGSAPF